MSPPWMPFYPADYLRDTRRLTPAQHGAYLLLIMEYWTVGNLPDDDAQLARVVGMSTAEWRKTRPVVQAFFQDGWRHKRIDDELAKAKVKQERRQEAGKRGGIAKANSWQNPSNATPLLEQNPDNALASSSQPQPEEKILAADAAPGSKAYAFEDGIIRLNQRDFDAWRKAYSHLDLAAELLSLSKWAESEGKNWFHAVKGALAKRNREVKAEKDRQAQQGGFKWNGIEGVI